VVSSGQISGADGRYQISGELSFTTVNAVLAESRETLFATREAQLELDLRSVTRADSAGLALLIQWLRMARAQQSDIRFLHLPEQLLAIARAGELEALLPIAG